MPTHSDGALAPAAGSVIAAGLQATPKTLPAALLYDELGSALFEAITLLPEYELTRADRRLLCTYAADVRAITGLCDLVELGAGNGIKAALFIGGYAPADRLRYCAVDVSGAALQSARNTLTALSQVEFQDMECDFIAGLRRAARRRGARPLLTLFLGSNLSNFDRDEAREFLRQVRSVLHEGDWLLLATDLDKDPHRLLPAYDDALGVTAAFNKNLLRRLNDEYQADFDLSSFRHEVRWSAAARRIEMHLVATRAMRVALPGLGLRIGFAAGESIWTESSHRFATEELRQWGRETGWSTAAQWVDPGWPFAHTLFRAGSKLVALPSPGAMHAGLT